MIVVTTSFAIRISSSLILLMSYLMCGAQTYNQGSANAVTITQTQKNAETINAVEFGVVGDGRTDNSSALQNAINDASAHCSRSFAVCHASST